MKPLTQSLHKLKCGMLLLGLSSVCAAHTPYVVSTSDEPVMGNMASFDASFAERFFIPEAAMDNSQFTITSPDGQRKPVDTQHALKTRVVLEQQLKQQGTYRISSGTRHGAIFVLYEVDGEKKRAMNPKEPLPKNAVVNEHFQSVTKADTYISHKKINTSALTVDDCGLQILPNSHPNELFSGEALTFTIFMDGKALANTKISVFSEDSDADGAIQEVTSSEKGEIKISLEAGRYLLRARHRIPAPATAKAPTYSHTSTLTLQVYENI